MTRKGGKEARGIAKLGSAIALMSAVLLSCLALISPQASAATYISGLIENPHWTAEDSPYVIVGDAILGPDDILIIDPGVEVRFGEGSSLYVEGRLSAGASEGGSITFTSNLTTKQPGDWGSIILTGHGNVIKNAWIQYAHRGLLLLEHASVSMEGVHLADNLFAGIYSENSSFEMKDTSIVENGEFGIYL
ncbi:MAG: hypothetical protein ACE5IJ_02915, partial [Thermoplasmata archaeon]